MPPGFEYQLSPRLDRLFSPLCIELSQTEIELLIQAISDHMQKIRDALRYNEFLDIQTAERISEILLTLLQRYPNYPKNKRAMIVGAARYFVFSNDAQSDLTSLLGFDDDVAVLNYVLDQIGHSDLRIPI